MKLRTIDRYATGEHLKNLFSIHGYTPKNIQRVLGFNNPQSIYRWFCNDKSGIKRRNIPSLDHLVILSQVFDVPIENLIIMKETGIELSELRKTGMG